MKYGEEEYKFNIYLNDEKGIPQYVGTVTDMEWCEFYIYACNETNTVGRIDRVKR